MPTTRSARPSLHPLATRWRRRRSGARPGGLALLAGALLVAGCAGGEVGKAAEPQLLQGPGKAEDFLVIDCLLPGQVRRLGAQATFLTARRPVKTSARDCEIRGGEYVAYDRASYATALKVWLPRAEQGESLAQTYVGEIFEKGLGVPPDHAAAAVWYRRAAESGYSRAAINLGYLYEQGLGVPKDPTQALAWYRRAAGLGELTFETTAATAEVRELRREVGALRRELQAKQAELDRAQGELEGRRRRLEERRGEADTERAALARLRREVEESRSREQAATARLSELGRSVADGEGRLAEKERELAGLRASLGRSEAESEARRARLEQRERESAAEVQRAQRELETLRRGLEQRRGDADAERAALVRLRQEQEELKGKAETATARLGELQRSIAEREGRLATRERELGDLRGSLARSQAESDARRAQLEQLRGESAAELTRAQQELDSLRRTLAQRGSEAESERGALGRLRQELEASRGREQASAVRLRELEGSIAASETRLAAKERELGDLRAALARSEVESGTLRAELERLRQRTTAAVPPEIQLIEPELIATRGTRAARAPGSVDRMVVVGRVVAADGLLSLTVNGREETFDGANLFKASVPLTKADEQVQIVAIDRAGRKSTLDFLVLARPDPGTPPSRGPEEKIGLPKPKGPLAFGNYHALVIGNNEYRQLKRLRTAVNDAREVARILGQEYGFKVTLLLNASRYEILSALNALRERLTEKDNLLIYYAGHGELDQRNQRGHWLPVDAEPGSTANWISNIAITDILNAMTVQQLLVVADSCYAGTLTRSALGRLEGAVSDQERLKVIELMAQKRSRMVLTSGGVEPVLDSAGGSHSAFAQIFIELLRANGGVLPGQDLFRLAQLRVAAIAQRLDAQQVPEYAPIKFAGHEAGDFFFVRAGS